MYRTQRAARARRADVRETPMSIGAAPRSHVATRVVGVPLLASSHSGHNEQIHHQTGGRADLDETTMHGLHMSGIEKPAANVPLTLPPTIDASMEIAGNWIRRRVLEASR